MKTTDHVGVTSSRAGSDTASDTETSTDPGADAAAVADLVALATHGLPPARWLVPTPRLRGGPLADHARIWVEHALQHGHVDTITTRAGLVAAAVWLRHDDPAHPTPVPDGYDRRVRRACRTYASRFHDLDAVLDAHQPHTRPHHRLVYLAVHPAHCGRGYGTSLLTVHHDRLDHGTGNGVGVVGDGHSSMGAFLTVTTPRGIESCRRHGYVPSGDPHHLPHGGPPLWPMWRQAASAPLGADMSSGHPAAPPARIGSGEPPAFRVLSREVS